METKMEANEYWEHFLKIHPEAIDSTYEIWAFGNTPKMADELLALVLEGEKTGTCSAKKLYVYTPDEPVPKEGEYSILTDGKNRPKAVIQTISVEEVAFCDVRAEFAYLEGEDDRSLEKWRETHFRYFQSSFHALGLEFTDKEILYCETFQVCASI